MKFIVLRQSVLTRLVLIMALILIMLSTSDRASAQAIAPKVVLDAAGFRAPWWSTGKPSQSGILRDTLRPWYGFGVRNAPWGVTGNMDTAGLRSNGRLHFMFRANKVRTIAFWLTSTSGIMSPKTFRSDTVWRSIDTTYVILNPGALMPQGINWQNNGGDTIFAELKDIAFRDSTPSVPVVPKPPRVSYLFIDDSTTIYDRLTFAAWVVDSFPIASLNFVLQNPQDSPLVAGTLQQKRITKDSLYVVTEWDVTDLSGWYTAGIRAINTQGFGVYQPFKVNIVHLYDTVSVACADSLKTYIAGWNDALNLVADSVETPKKLPVVKPPKK